jgi:FlaA1/EpsC-like NDP-sugar epimerase
VPDNPARFVVGASVRLHSLDRCVVVRDRSLFADDMDANRQRIRERLSGRRVLVVGGAGTIGSATTNLLAEFEPGALHVIDQNENYLAELVRDLRSRLTSASRIDLRMWPIDYGGPIARRLIEDEAPYDIVLNFAALKHVRSEKDAYSLLQMIDTNVVRQARFKHWIAERGGCTRYFGVSTDKAANPVSVMGATKRLMEDVLFGVAVTEACAVTSARFANVAFSNGSLLQAWLRRLELGQPLAVPRDTRRYFVTQRESGEICVLAALLAKDGEIIVPRLDSEVDLRLLEDLAVDVLSVMGFEAAIFVDEAAARDELDHLRSSGRWPLILAQQDTSGEKPVEEFVGEGETTREVGLKKLLAVSHGNGTQLSMDLLSALGRLVADPGRNIAKADIVATIAAVIPNFRHIETGRSLDQRM